MHQDCAWPYGKEAKTGIFLSSGLLRSLFWKMYNFFPGSDGTKQLWMNEERDQNAKENWWNHLRGAYCWKLFSMNCWKISKAESWSPLMIICAIPSIRGHEQGFETLKIRGLGLFTPLLNWGLKIPSILNPSRFALHQIPRYRQCYSGFSFPDRSFHFMLAPLVPFPAHLQCISVCLITPCTETTTICFTLACWINLFISHYHLSLLTSCGVSALPCFYSASEISAFHFRSGNCSNFILISV